MIAVVIPAHNEAQNIGACLHAVNEAACNAALQAEPVVVIVTDDASSDATAEVAAAYGARVLSISVRNVGRARGVGAAQALELGARWLAFTDADSIVAKDWLSSQIALGRDAVCGTVQVTDWEGYSAHMQQHYARTYNDHDGHRHIHGANMGVSAAAYRRVGGFRALASSEDVALVNALQLHGCDIAWSAAPRVTTSARRDFRAPAGFGATLCKVNEEAHWDFDEDSI